MKRTIFCILNVCLLFFTGCKNSDELYNPEGLDEDTLKVNKFAVDVFADRYLWVDDIDIAYYKKTYNTYRNPEELFQKLKHKDDKWSLLTNDIEGLGSSFEGVETSFGYNLLLTYAYRNSDIVIGIVKFVYRDSPADRAGLKRGDIIVTMNGNSITDKNYMELYSSSSITVSRGYAEDGQFKSKGESIRMTAVKQYNNPVLKDTVIIKGASRIGYFCYSDFLEKSEAELIRAFGNFRNQGVTDVVLDLRYNPGGALHTSIILSSILAPVTAVKNKDIFQIQIWNKTYTQYWKSKNSDMTEHFTDTLSVNMNLNRIYVLTSGNSASASEATIVALKPYMNVVQIGDTTSGKFVGGSLVSPKNIYENRNYYQNIANWGMYVMYFRFTNKNETYFTGGLTPDIQVKESFLNLYPFGDERDPLLGRAIAQITGQPYIEQRSIQEMPDFEIRKDLSVKRAIDGRLIDSRKLPLMLR